MPHYISLSRTGLSVEVGVYGLWRLEISAAVLLGQGQVNPEISASLNNMGHLCSVFFYFNLMVSNEEGKRLWYLSAPSPWRRSSFSQTFLVTLAPALLLYCPLRCWFCSPHLFIVLAEPLWLYIQQGQITARLLKCHEETFSFRKGQVHLLSNILDACNSYKQEYWFLDLCWL